MIHVTPVAGLGEIRAGDDLGALLGGALADLDVRAGDVLAVTSKIVSKAEDRFVDLATVTPGSRAREIAAECRKDPRLVELVLAHSAAVVRVGPNVLITRHRLGLVMANAGIDASNIGRADADIVLLLPQDPDASAERLRDDLGRRLRTAPGVILTDSFGRPWRHGVVNVTIGAAGFPAIVDRRGGADRDGRVLQVTQIALGDLVASAAGLVMGEGAEGVPAALVRGLALPDAPAAGASALVRPVAEDLFR